MNVRWLAACMSFCSVLANQRIEKKAMVVSLHGGISPSMVMPRRDLAKSLLFEQELKASTHWQPEVADALPACLDYMPPDEEKWYDSYGTVHAPERHDYWDCSWYGRNEGNGDHCKLYGHEWHNFGKTANSACCACGGGVHQPGQCNKTNDLGYHMPDAREGRSCFVEEVTRRSFSHSVAPRNCPCGKCECSKTFACIQAHYDAAARDTQDACNKMRKDTATAEEFACCHKLLKPCHDWMPDCYGKLKDAGKLGSVRNESGVAQPDNSQENNDQENGDDYDTEDENDDNKLLQRSRQQVLVDSLAQITLKESSETHSRINLDAALQDKCDG